MTRHLPDPTTSPELFDGILTRRVFAFLIDMTAIGALVIATLLVGLVAGLLTFGLALVALPFALIGVIVAYYAATLGSWSRATLGMRAMDIVMTPTRDTPLDGWRAFVHPLVFWITIWICWPISLAAVLFTPRRQMIHDLVAGVLLVRRSPMLDHWRGHAGMSAI